MKKKILSFFAVVVTIAVVLIVIIPTITKDSSENFSNNKTMEITEKINVTTNQHYNLEITIANKIYSLYSNESEESIKIYRDYLHTDISNIGKEVSILDQSNMGEFDIYTGIFNNMSEVEAKEHPLYHAKVYKYNNCKNNTLMLAENDGYYYMFKLSSFISDSPESNISAKDIFNLYSLNGKNPVASIEIYSSKWEKENDENYQAITHIKTIEDNAEIDFIMDILNDSEINSSENDIFDSLSELSEDKYYITFVFEDNTRLYLSVTENYYYFSIILKNRYGYYLLNTSQYESLKEKFEL